MMVRIVSAFALFLSLIASAALAFAQSAAPQTTTSHQFDFYVLSLSWSPSYCEAAGDKRKDPECARILGFVVHGLWPQYEKGYPSDCADTTDRLPQSLIKAELDLFPAPGLVVHEWKKHGSCTGLDPAAFFDAVRKANAGITVPANYSHIDKPTYTAPDQIAKDFIAANKGLDATEFAVVCGKQRLDEVRICLDKDLKTFHPCPQIAAAACKQDKTYLPAEHAAN